MDQEVLSCGAVIVRQTDEGVVTLMLRAWHNWDFPKGLQEAGEEPQETAIREVGEETGVKELEFEWGDRFMDTGPYSRGKVARYYLARTSESEVVMGISPETGSPEHNCSPTGHSRKIPDRHSMDESSRKICLERI